MCIDAVWVVCQFATFSCNDAKYNYEFWRSKSSTPTASDTKASHTHEHSTQFDIYVNFGPTVQIRLAVTSSRAAVADRKYRGVKGMRKVQNN